MGGKRTMRLSAEAAGAPPGPSAEAYELRALASARFSGTLTIPHGAVI